MNRGTDTDAQKAEFVKDPTKYHRYHKTVEKSLNGRFRTLLRDTAESDEVNAVSRLIRTYDFPIDFRG